MTRNVVRTVALLQLTKHRIISEALARMFAVFQFVERSLHVAEV